MKLTMLRKAVFAGRPHAKSAFIASDGKLSMRKLVPRRANVRYAVKHIVGRLIALVGGFTWKTGSATRNGSVNAVGRFTDIVKSTTGNTHRGTPTIHVSVADLNRTICVFSLDDKSLHISIQPLHPLQLYRPGQQAAGLQLTANRFTPFCVTRCLHA